VRRLCLNDAIAQALPMTAFWCAILPFPAACGAAVFRANGPLMNIHSLAGAIGMGLPMAVGTAIANRSARWWGWSATAA
jgi:acetolactate synthase-1/2/3 large subunit